MNKYRAAMLALSLLTVATSGISIAADSTTAPTRQEKSQPNPSDPSMTPDQKARPAGGGSAKDEEAYQAKLKKCDGMSNANDKKMCADKAKKERDQM
jgi:hypothetical protein